jgi:hypothetical protein
MLASVVMDRARAALNDRQGQLFTNDVLLPFVNNAWEDLQSEMQNNGLPTVYETSAVLSIPAGAIVVSTASTPPLPTDIIEPRNVYEKLSSETRWIPMKEYNDLLPSTQGNRLGLWQWRDDELRLVGSTVATQLLIEYTKSLIDITGPNTVIPLNAAKLFLAYKTAAEAASDIGQNGTRASSLSLRAEVEKSKFISIRVKGTQGVSTRRIPYTRRVQWRSLLPF